MAQRRALVITGNAGQVAGEITGADTLLAGSLLLNVGAAIDSTPAANEWILALGAETGPHLAFDGSKIAAKANATTWGDLTLQPYGGAVITGGNFNAGARIKIGTVGTYEAGVIYSDANWGMLFRALQVSPAIADFVWIDAAATERMRLDVSGNLGLGVAPTSRLHVFGTNPVLQIQRASGGDTIEGIRFLDQVGGSGYFIGIETLIENALVLRAGSNSTNERFRLTQDGQAQLYAGVLREEPERGSSEIEDFDGGGSFLETRFGGLVVTTTNGAQIGGAADAAAEGVIAVQINAAAGSTCGLNFRRNIYFGNGARTLKTRVRIPTLSNATDRFWVRTGFTDAAGLIDGNDGAYFRYKDDVNSGNWVCVCRANNVETATNTSTPPLANTWQIFEIVVNSLGTSVDFYINGTAVATITTNIPTGTARGTNIAPIAIIRTAGSTNARTAECDYAQYVYTRSSNR